ncbi:methyltransferase [Carboxylicivirga sp. N1Y90]|uniref:methyltransferase n=1 Tax=Carboxylicivirga fragile TaxID=3417571 RepID=UPI003D343813|nr:SAM-dependent methyltransferase [Marinilabiliaceae bacterium N1Y90]
MSVSYGEDKKSALQAKFDAQKIAFAPIMFQASLALRNLGILELIKKHRKGISIKAIAEELNLSVYGVKVLLEAGLSLELVIVNEDKYKLTKTGWYILCDELTRVNMDFTQDVNYEGMFSLEDSIKEGKPTGLKVFGDWPTVYEGLAHLPEKAKESWFAFDHYYSDYAFPEVLPLVFKNKPRRILDVGGNTGKFSIQCAKHNPDVKVTILDLPGQLNVAYENIESNGFSDRIDGHPLNLLDHDNAFPQGADIVWMSQFLDCFSQEDILQLLIRSANAINEQGRVYILETYWDDQEFEASTYSLHATSLYFTNIANGCSQMYHTEDMLALIEKAGLEVEERVSNIGVSHTLLICKKT